MRTTHYFRQSARDRRTAQLPSVGTVRQVRADTAAAAVAAADDRYRRMTSAMNVAEWRALSAALGQ